MIEPIDGNSLWKICRKILVPKIPAWRRRKAILNRIRSYHRKAGNILEDWARKASLKMVRLAVKLQHALAREGLTGLIESLGEIKS